MAPAHDAPRITLVAARAANGVIGRDGQLPWRLSTDLKHFKAITFGKPVLMGRKTWASLPGALPGRANLVVSRNPELMAPGAWVFTDLTAAIAAARAMAVRAGQSELCIIGGGALYTEALPFADALYLTEVDARPEGDAFFPQFDETEFVETERRDFPAGAADDFSGVFRVLERRRVN
jgi:dihydrofolate reductase